MSADVAAGQLQQRRLLSRRALSLDPDAQSSSADTSEEESSFVDEVESSPVNATDMSAQAAAPIQEAGSASLGAQIISAQACTQDLQSPSPCDSLLQQLSLDENNAYRCFVHLKDATSFEELTKATDASCFVHESYELTNGATFPTISRIPTHFGCVPRCLILLPGPAMLVA